MLPQPRLFFDLVVLRRSRSPQTRYDSFGIEAQSTGKAEVSLQKNVNKVLSAEVRYRYVPRDKVWFLKCSVLIGYISFLVL